jgi:hypothetical protein
MAPPPIMRPQLDPYAASLRALRSPASMPVLRLPRAEVVAPHDPALAALLETAQSAQSQELGAAMAWQACEPGGAAFNAALAADLDAARRQLAEMRTLPDDPAGALLDHLTVGRHAAYVAAVRAQAATDHAVAAVYRYVAAAQELRERLDAETDRLVDEMVEHLTAARDRKDRARYIDGERLKRAWHDMAAVYRWLVNPGVPYRHPIGKPNELPWPKVDGFNYLEWEADAAIHGGKERPIIPEPPAPYVPRRAATPSPDLPAAVAALEPRWRLLGGWR